MEHVAKKILETIGNTPLVRIGRMNAGAAEVVAKVESINPGSSSKDRIGIAMILDAERKGLLKRGATIIEPTSGSAGLFA